MPASLDAGNGPSVGASLLAKNSQAPRLSRKHALALTVFASKLAPTGRRSSAHANPPTAAVS
ncbi:hypothetical protein DK871_19010 [Pseudomonas sp. L13]|nr:hypothetical protein [Pseudomonas sp. L13]